VFSPTPATARPTARTLALELAPIRVNALHPAAVGDSPAWAGKQEVLDRAVARTPTKKLATMKDVASATGEKQ
jgi:NAD(P)-dependent dehydrogenase (short-subunit alcohol dehydrogenase family)